MKNALRIALALGAFFVVAVTLAACGASSSNSLSGDDVALVNGTPITKADYTHWSAVTAHSVAGNNTNAVVPDPPAYTNCLAQLSKQTKTPKSQKPPTTAALIAQCKAQNQAVIQQTMGTLIQTAWVEGEAKQRGLSVTDAAVRQQLAQTKRQSFPTAVAYDKFLATSGMTPADVLHRVRVQMLAQLITQKIQSTTVPVSEAQIASYYNHNRRQFSLPERRDLEIVLTQTKAQAQAAKAAITSGQSWPAVVKKYSSDAASKATGGVLRGVAKGQQDKALDTAAFSAREGLIVGPLKGKFGWYLVRVTAITPASQTPLAQAKAQIRPLLSQQGGQLKMTAFISDFQKRWKSETNCRVGYIIMLCKNAPKAAKAAPGN
jgi:foldase protein PrsA